MRRGWTPFQYVEPPRIVRKMHADMVGHEIENQPEIVLLERPAQPLKTVFAAEFRIERGVIDDVVAMGRTLARLHEGRRIEMRDAKRFEVGDDGSGGIEVEVCRHLHAPGRDRNRPRHQPPSGYQNTDHGATRSLRFSPRIWLSATLIF